MERHSILWQNTYVYILLASRRQEAAVTLGRTMGQNLGVEGDPWRPSCSRMRPSLLSEDRVLSLC
jgi:hypothetical protein